MYDVVTELENKKLEKYYDEYGKLPYAKKIDLITNSRL